MQRHGGDAGAVAMSADGVWLERAGVPGGSSETVRGNGQASGRKPAQPRGTARRRVGFLRPLVVGEATFTYRHLGVVGDLGEGSLGV